MKKSVSYVIPKGGKIDKNYAYMYKNSFKMIKD